MSKNRKLNRLKPKKLRKKKVPLSSVEEPKFTPPSTDQSTSDGSLPQPGELKLSDGSTNGSTKHTKEIHKTEEEKDTPTPLKKNSEEILKEQYKALNKKYQFLMAEYANYKKNSLKDLENFRKYEAQHFIQHLLSEVIDHFDRAMEQEINTQNAQDFKKGISMIYTNLKKLLEKKGVKEIDCKGKAFDPAFHCALDSAPSEQVPPEHILHVIKKAYLFHDKLIRPAEVIVARKQPKEPDPLQDKDKKG